MPCFTMRDCKSLLTDTRVAISNKWLIKPILQNNDVIKFPEIST